MKEKIGKIFEVLEMIITMDPNPVRSDPKWWILFF